jgi:DNA mismatch endonuclease (patch repair protein)
MKSKDPFTPEERSRIMGLVKSKDTSIELIVRRLVHRLGYRYRLHVASLPGTPDLVFPARRKIIFINGCFWHMHGCGRCRIPAARRDYWINKLSKNRLRDARNRRQLRRSGWSVMTVWECQARDLTRLGRAISRFIEQPIDRN